MSEIEPPRSRPIQAELVLVASGSDVRMATGLYVGIDANGYGRRRAAFLDLPRGFADQDLKFRFRFNIEKQYPLLATAPRGAIAQRFANLMPVLAHAGKDNAIAANPNPAQVFQLTSGDYVEATPHPRQLVQNRKITVRLDGKAQRMRQRSKAAVEFSISIFDGRTAI